GDWVGDLLQLPLVPVRVAELRERRIGAPLGIGAARPGVGIEAVEAAARVVEDLAGVDTVADELVVRRLDVGDDEETLRRAGGSRREPLAELDRAPGARGRELDHPEVVIPEVRVQPPPEALVELLRAVDIRDW